MITIIVLLILAAVSIVTLTGENGILKQSNNAKTSTLQATEKEEILLSYQAVKMAKLANEDNSEITSAELEIELKQYDTNATVILEDNIFMITMTNGIYELLNNNGNVELRVKDTTGETKTTKVASDITASDYGKSVNYIVSVTNNNTNNKEEVSGWKIFYADDTNIYLISDSYVKCSLLATTTNNGEKTNHQVTWSTGDANNPTARFDNVLQDYVGSESITTANLARKWLSQYLNNYSSTKDNMKAVAYMLDTLAWSEYANSKAEYAIGGPTLELFVASYNKTHTEQLEIEASSDVGYRLKRSTDSEMQNYLSNFNTDDNLYIPKEEKGAITMWLASPSYNSEKEIMAVYSGGYVSNNEITNTANGFKPVVCLKGSTELNLSSDGSSYEIVE